MHVFLSTTFLSLTLATTSLLALAKVNINVKNDEKALCNAIYKAASHNDESTVKNYIGVIGSRNYNCSDFNKLPGSKGDGGSLLHLAARQGDINAVKLLIKHGFSLLLENVFGDTFLHAALYNKHPNLVKEALAMFSPRDAKEIANLLAVREKRLGDTVLHLACDNHLVGSEENEELVTLLLEKGASPSVLNNENQSPYNVALLHNNTNLFDILNKYLEEEKNREELLRQADSKTMLMPVLGVVIGAGISSLIIYKLRNYMRHKSPSALSKKSA